MESLAARLRRLRTERVLTQEDLAAASGVPVVTISRIETEYNHGQPRPTTIKKLAGSLGVSPTYLLFGEEIEELKIAA